MQTARGRTERQILVGHDARSSPRHAILGPFNLQHVIRKDRAKDQIFLGRSILKLVVISFIVIVPLDGQFLEANGAAGHIALHNSDCRFPLCCNTTDAAPGGEAGSSYQCADTARGREDHGAAVDADCCWLLLMLVKIRLPSSKKVGNGEGHNNNTMRNSENLDCVIAYTTK